jgi:uncharacterized protein (DUF1684 family)
MSPEPRAAWEQWRAVRDQLFATHPQSPLPEEKRRTFTGLAYFAYDPGARVLADVGPCAPELLEIATDSSSYRFTRFTVASFELYAHRLTLDLYWLDGYGGGVFLPFRDTTSGRKTYGAGRYLLDTVKGADLGTEGNRLVLDFNFAYNPSCAYDPCWVCPLPPPSNWLLLPVQAGERLRRR